MKYHHQTIFSFPTEDDPTCGDCTRTALACLLDADKPEDVPHFVQEHGDEWYSAMARWLNDRGMGIVMHTFGEEIAALITGLCMIGVRTSNPDNPDPENMGHMVVGRCRMRDDGYYFDVIHDPNPAQHKIEALREAYFIVRCVGGEHG